MKGVLAGDGRRPGHAPCVVIPDGRWLATTVRQQRGEGLESPPGRCTRRGRAARRREVAPDNASVRGIAMSWDGRLASFGMDPNQSAGN